MELLVTTVSLGLAILALAFNVESERKKLDRDIKHLSQCLVEVSDSLSSNLLETADGLAKTKEQLKTAVKQLNSVSEVLLEKEDKRTLTIDEALARIPKKSALKQKKPSRKTPTLARKLTKAK
jgi:uncharacterized membrane-anchored protein YhcB (DUF1043 family)